MFMNTFKKSSNLLALLAFLSFGVMSLVQAFSLTTHSSRNDAIAASLAKNSFKPDPKDQSKKISTNKEKVQFLKRHNYFFPIVPRPPQLSSIMGNEAYINDRWLKVGDTIEGEKIKSIFQHYVELEKEGKTRKLTVSGFSQ